MSGYEWHGSGQHGAFVSVLDLWYYEMSAEIPTIAELAAAVEQRGL